jgi:hypothetical protein
MISLNRSFPVNPPGEIVLTRSEVWSGLEMKARDAPRFVKRMQSCVVIEDGELELVRDIVIRDEPHRERVTFTPESTVRFERIEGNTTGFITNEIHDEPDGLTLRFTFNLERTDLDPGGEEERAHFAKVEAEYEDAIHTTLETIRGLARDRTDAASTNRERSHG